MPIFIWLICRSIYILAADSASICLRFLWLITGISHKRLFQMLYMHVCYLSLGSNIYATKFEFGGLGIHL